MWTGPLACLSLSSVVVLDKDQGSRSGIGSLLLLLPRCERKLYASSLAPLVARPCTIQLVYKMKLL